MSVPIECSARPLMPDTGAVNRVYDRLSSACRTLAWACCIAASASWRADVASSYSLRLTARSCDQRLQSRLLALCLLGLRRCLRELPFRLRQRDLERRPIDLRTAARPPSPRRLRCRAAFPGCRRRGRAPRPASSPRSVPTTSNSTGTLRASTLTTWTGTGDGALPPPPAAPSPFPHPLTSHAAAIASAHVTARARDGRGVGCAAFAVGGIGVGFRKKGRRDAPGRWYFTIILVCKILAQKGRSRAPNEAGSRANPSEDPRLGAARLRAPRGHANDDRAYRPRRRRHPRCRLLALRQQAGRVRRHARPGVAAAIRPPGPPRHRRRRPAACDRNASSGVSSTGSRTARKPAGRSRSCRSSASTSTSCGPSCGATCVAATSSSPSSSRSSSVRSRREPCAATCAARPCRARNLRLHNGVAAPLADGPRWRPVATARRHADRRARRHAAGRRPARPGSPLGPAAT